MFFVINKEKVYAYVVSILTIVTLFFMSHVLNSDFSNVEETATNIEQNINSNSNVTNMNLTNTNENANIMEKNSILHE